MLKKFNDLPIGKKLKRINLLSVSVIALVTSLSLGGFLYFSLLNNYGANALTQARVLAGNLDSTLMFGDKASADATLANLRYAGDVDYAALYGAQGHLFASYGRTPAMSTAIPQMLGDNRTEGTTMSRLRHQVSVPVFEGQDSTRTVGTLLISQNLSDSYQHLLQQLAVVFAGAFFALAIGAMLLDYMQRYITRPLQALSDTMHRLRNGGDLSARARVESADEVGDLARSFNHLMDELSRRDVEASDAHKRFETVLKAVPDLMFEVDADGRYINVWGIRGDLLAAPANELNGRRVRDVLPLAASATVEAALEEAGTSVDGQSSGKQITLLLPVGEHTFELSVAKLPRIGTKIVHFLVLSRDVTDRKRAEGEIRRLAFYDALTGLPNRRLLMDRLQAAMLHSQRTGNYGAILFLDLDRFKSINDTLGHDHGDMLLLQVAKRIQSCLRETDTVARMGGDEFVVLLEQIDSDIHVALSRTAQLAEKIRTTLAQPYQLNAHERHSSPSVGVCMYLGCTIALEDLIKKADLAMYQAKEDGRNLVRFFDPEMQEAVQSRALLDADLRASIFEQQLRLFYQPQVDHNGNLIGAEALVRWDHPIRGMVQPAQFIPIAEESQIIVDIGNWVMDTACRQLSVWACQPSSARLVIAVNVSAQQFKQPGFVQQVQTMLMHHGVKPECLKLELTESVVLSDLKDVVAKMQALKTIGLRLSLDDFGTGYSSLAYLKELPLDQIKIDRSFVRDLEKDASDAMMVRTIIGLANNFNLDVIAEGVENSAQLDFLLVNGCRSFQGFYFGRPVPIEEFALFPEKQHPTA